jgi:hypothetical protein
MNFLKFVCFVSLISLTACGGGGSANAGDTAQQSALGIWIGTTSSSYGTTSPAIGIVLDSGEYFFATGSDYSGVAFGKASLSGSAFSSDNLKNYDPSLGTVVNGFFTGTVSTGSSMSLKLSETYQGITYLLTGNFTFDSKYNEPSALATITGTYVSPTTFGNTYTYTVDGNGVLTGSSAKCTFNGQITIRNSTKNVYNLALTTGNAAGQTCPAGARTLLGVATYIVMPNRNARSLVLITATNSGGNYYWVTAAGERQ